MDIRKLVSGLLACIVAGCGTPLRKSPRATDWESPEFAASHKPAALSSAPSTAPVAPMQRSAAIHKYEMSWLSLESWCEHNQHAMPVRLSGTPAVYSLDASNGSFVLRSGSTSAYWDGLEVRLGFPPQFIDGHLFVHGLDLEKTIDPLLTQWAPPGSASHPVAVIDPGHGGNDPGARASGSACFEKELTLDWALRLAPLLASNGWRVFLTRTSDVSLALSNRVSFAEAHRADLFISLHFNSSPEGKQRGLETYCLTPAGMQSTITRGEDDSSASYPNNAFDAQNLGLAYRVHAALVRATASSDRGVRRARFPGVLRNQNRPAILVEGGYVSNRDEAARITDPGYRQTLAEAVQQAICGETVTVAAATPAGQGNATPRPGSTTLKATAVP